MKRLLFRTPNSFKRSPRYAVRFILGLNNYASHFQSSGRIRIPFAKCISGWSETRWSFGHDDFYGRYRVNILRNCYATAEGNNPARISIRRDSRPQGSPSGLSRITLSKSVRALGFIGSYPRQATLSGACTLADDHSHILLMLTCK